jgi:hypothetical protein
VASGFPLGVVVTGLSTFLSGMILGTVMGVVSRLWR